MSRQNFLAKPTDKPTLSVKTPSWQPPRPGDELGNGARSDRINYDAAEAILNAPSSPARSEEDTTPSSPPPAAGKRPHSPEAVPSLPSRLSRHDTPQATGSNRLPLPAITNKASSGRQLGTPLEPNTLFSSQRLQLPKPRPTKRARTHTQPDLPTPSSQSHQPPSTLSQPDQRRRTSTTRPNHVARQEDATSTQTHSNRYRAVPPIPTSPSISQTSHLDRFLALSRLSGRRKPFKSNVDRPFREAAERAAQAYLANPTAENLLLFLEIPKRWLTPALNDKSHPVRWRMDQFMKEDMQWPPVSRRDDDGSRDRVKEAELLVEKGQLGTGMRVLTDESAVAKMSDATLESLISKHPSGTPLPFGTGPGPACGRPPTKDDVKRILDLTDSDSAPGISGWTFRMLKIVAKSPTVLEFLTILTSSINAGTAPGAEMLCSSRLTTLDKVDGGIRPLAVGEVMYRLAMKTILDKALAHKSPL